MVTTANNRLYSVGRLAQVLGAMPNTIMVTAQRINEAPALVLNEISYFDEVQAQRIRNELSKGKA